MSGIKCKVVDNQCAELQQGSIGKCRLCEFSTMGRTVEVTLLMRDYQFIMEQCEKDGMSISMAVTELVNQGIRSLRRHI